MIQDDGSNKTGDLPSKPDEMLSDSGKSSQFAERQYPVLGRRCNAIRLNTSAK